MGNRKYKNPTKELIDGKIKQTKSYGVWKSMIQRCNNEKVQEKHPTYKDCSVCEEWKDFDNFYLWYQDNYREGFHLDKDILYQNNKVYSPDTCVFVPQYINSLLTKSDAARGELPIGVCFNRILNKYAASLGINNKKKHLGLFSCPIEAHKTYAEAKYAYIKETALNALKIGDIDERVYYALLDHKIPMY